MKPPLNTNEQAIRNNFFQLETYFKFLQEMLDTIQKQFQRLKYLLISPTLLSSY